MDNKKTIRLEYVMTSEEMQEGVLVFNPNQNKIIQTIHIVFFVLSILGFSTLLLEGFFYLKVLFVFIAGLLLFLNVYSILRHYQMWKQAKKSSEDETLPKEIKYEIEITKDTLFLKTLGKEIEESRFNIEQISRVTEKGEYVYLVIDRGDEELLLFLIIPQKEFSSENEMATFLEYANEGTQRESE